MIQQNVIESSVSIVHALLSIVLWDKLMDDTGKHGANCRTCSFLKHQVTRIMILYVICLKDLKDIILYYCLFCFFFGVGLRTNEEMQISHYIVIV